MTGQESKDILKKFLEDQKVAPAEQKVPDEVSEAIVNAIQSIKGEAKATKQLKKITGKYMGYKKAVDSCKNSLIDAATNGTSVTWMTVIEIFEKHFDKIQAESEEGTE